MALQSFRVENRRSIRLAEAVSVPPVMVIAGPNGVGKSTLLFAVKEGNRVADDGTLFLYQGPHRVMRSTNVRRSWLGGPIRGIRDLLGMNEVTGYEGLSFFNPARTPENVDEAGSTIKHTLGKMENRRQNLLASAVDRQKKANEQFNLAAIPDIYEPLRRLTEFLLPHLVFERVDFSAEDNIKCIWKRTNAAGTNEVDIDALSSGEKAVIVLFLPLLEDQIEARLKELENFGLAPGEDEAPAVDRVVLIDEPEQHLHPDLQAKILTYIRNISRVTRTQFIITTHSPTILDQAFDTELYVLSEPSNAPEENQLRQIATSSERLEALKQLAGSTYFLTTGRVIVCIEGERDSDPDKPTDARLLEILYPRTTAVTLVPTAGKGNVIQTVGRLRTHVPEATYRIRIRGLVDADQSQGGTPEGIETLPVCMIENLLLDPASIHEYLQSIGAVALVGVDGVCQELRSISAGFREKEIELRTRRRLGSHTVRMGGASIAAVKAKQAEEIALIEGLLPADAELAQIVATATTAVDGIITAGTELEQFRGKDILEEFHRRHINPQGVGYNQACIDLAKIIAGKNTISGRLDPVFDRLLA